MKRPGISPKRTIFVVVLLATLFTFAPAGAAAKNVSNGRIAFTSDRDGDQEIFVMDADGANQTQLTFKTASDGSAALLSPAPFSFGFW